MTTSRRLHLVVRPVAQLALGLVVIGMYKVLAHYDVGGIGAPSDIGGGSIPLAGLVLVAIGVVNVLGVAVRVRRRPSR